MNSGGVAGWRCRASARQPRPAVVMDHGDKPGDDNGGVVKTPERMANTTEGPQPALVRVRWEFCYTLAALRPFQGQAYHRDHESRPRKRRAGQCSEPRRGFRGDCRE